jgi:hypothetical protein
MKIFCLIAFVFLATSFTTNNENFKNISKSETLEVKKPTEEYRVNAYTKGISYSGTIEWQKTPIKISVNDSYGTITVIGIIINGSWVEVNRRVEATSVMFDGKDIASQFEYKSDLYYFNF